MNVRISMHLLALSSNNTSDASGVSPGDVFTTDATGGWITNAAGFKFNENYGFGLIDAGKFIELATQYGGVSTEVLETVRTTLVDLLIPDHSASNPFASATFVLDSTMPLEQIEVHLNISHDYRGQLEAFLISPSGIASRLF
jgi:Proprotein convertase P-domain